MRAIALAVLVLAGALSLAQVPPRAKEPTLRFPKAGARTVWIQSQSELGREASGQEATETTFKLAVPEVAATDSLVLVLDADTSRVAAKPLVEVVKAGGWEVKPADEKFLAELRVAVTEGAAPAESAMVEAKVGSQTRTALIGPADAGIAVLRLVPFGEAAIAAALKTAKGEVRLDPVKVGVSREAKGLEVTLRGPARPDANAPKPEPPKPEPPKPTASLFMALLNTLFGLAVVAAVVAGVVWLVKRNPKGVEEKLAQLGVAPAPPANDPVPPPLAPEPMKPIVLEDAAPVVPLPPLASAVPVPRLVRADGSVVILGDGPTRVGREAGNDVVLEGGGSVSRNHAAVETANGEATLTDLGSTNGTFVNGQRLTGPVKLKPGDAVMFGSEAFRFEA